MDDLATAWDARIAALLGRLPTRVGSAVAWLREPSRHLVRFVAGVLLVLGGIFSILPILGIWMLPLGLALLAEDMPGLKPQLERAARWCERRWRAFRGKTAGPELPKRDPAGRDPARPVPVRVRPPSGA
jgi:hypothetical protein